MANVTVDVPEGALSVFRLSPTEFVKEMRVAAALLWYLERGVTVVDPNDFEDVGFCQHLSLDADVETVTGDSALRRCLERTFSLLNDLDDESCHTKIRVCGLAEFAPGLPGGAPA